jgi:hypothetical protein
MLKITAGIDDMLRTLLRLVNCRVALLEINFCTCVLISVMMISLFKHSCLSLRTLQFYQHPKLNVRMNYWFLVRARIQRIGVGPQAKISEIRSQILPAYQNNCRC